MSAQNKLHVVLISYEQQRQAAETAALILAANEQFYPEDDEQLSRVMKALVGDLKLSPAAFQRSLMLQSSVHISTGTTDYKQAALDAKRHQGILVMPENRFDETGKAQCFAVWLLN